MEKRYTVRLNSSDKIEELLQEVYDQQCRLINEIQNNIDKLTNSTNLGEEGTSMEDKAKYAKAMHDFVSDKDKAIKGKLEIAKFMGEVLKYKGDAEAALNDPTFSKASKMDLKSLKAGIRTTTDDDSGDKTTYNLKK